MGLNETRIVIMNVTHMLMFLDVPILCKSLLTQYASQAVTLQKVQCVSEANYLRCVGLRHLLFAGELTRFLLSITARKYKKSFM